MKRLTFPSILALVVLASPLQAQTLGERIDAVRKQQQAERQSAQTSLLQALFYRKVTASFDRTPARDVFAYLETDLGVKVVGRYSDDPIGHGIDPLTPITINAEEMPAVTALDLVLEQCSGFEECTWQLRRTYLEVGTKERLATQSAQTVRTYPIDDLVYEAPRFDDAPSVGVAGYGQGYGVYAGEGHGNYGGFGGGRYGGSSGGYSGTVQVVSGGTVEDKTARARELVEMVLDAVEPNAWIQNGGEWASIRYRDGALIVRAPDFIHRQIGGYPHVRPPKGWKPPASAEAAKP